MADELDWAPLTVRQVATLFHHAPFRWWIAGGHALELHLGWSWRTHVDIDVGICRVDLAQLHARFADWDVRAGPTNRWLRRDPDGPWQIDVTVGAGDGDGWLYRRDTAISRPWHAAVLITGDGIPYLAPELQLLFKSKNPRSKDTQDAEMVIPRLDRERWTSLRSLLPTDHPWQTLIPT